MNLHLIVDYSFLYYKYKFQLDSGKMKRLSKTMEWNGVTVEKDISQIYYSIREIEMFRREWESQGHNVVISVCFDMPSKRKAAQTEESEKYKSNRGHKLTPEDHENIRFVQTILNTAGYNTYRFEGYEADDLVAYLVNNYQSEFDYNIIYTPDADLLVNISDKVGARRYKTGKGYTEVKKENFSEYLSAEMKCVVPYNALTLYKCTVGDKSDCIDGIKKFGPAAFTKLVQHLNTFGIDWTTAANYEAVKNMLDKCVEYLKPEQLEQAYASLELVRPETIPDGLIVKPESVGSKEKREEAYLPLDMNSLVE